MKVVPLLCPYVPAVVIVAIASAPPKVRIAALPPAPTVDKVLRPCTTLRLVVAVREIPLTRSPIFDMMLPN